MRRTIVIGIGNSMMSDDGLGVRVVTALKNDLESRGIAAAAGETDFEYCLDIIKGNGLLIIIDAMHTGREPGSIETFRLGTISKNRSIVRSQHELSLPCLVALHYPDIQGYVIGIEAAETGFGPELGQATGNIFKCICESVLKMVLEISSNGMDKVEV